MSDFDLVRALWIRKSIKGTSINEINGVLPLYFIGNGNYLKDYRIYGNTVNGKSVGDLVTDETDEHFGKYKVSVKIAGKNIICDDWETGTIDYKTGAFQTNNNYIRLKTNYNIDKKSHILSFEGNSTMLPRVFFYDENNTFIGSADVDNYSVFIPPDNAVFFNIRVKKSDNLVKLQIETGNLSTNYEPYYPPVITDIYLNEPIATGQYINFQNPTYIYGDIQLPKILTINGTNILYVNTQIQPSNVYIKGKIKTV